jgi:hypothetical protein
VQNPPDLPATKTRAWWRYTRRTLLVLGFLAVAFVFACAVYQFVATVSDARRFPQP